MDIVKVVNLFMNYLKVDFFEFINVFIGKGIFIIKKFSFLIVSMLVGDFFFGLMLMLI